MELITKKQAKQLGLNFYFTGKPCKRNHICEKYISNRGCVECDKQRSNCWHENNKERKQQTSKSWEEKNKEHRQQSKKQWKENNPDKITEYGSRRCKYLKYSKPIWAAEEIIKQIYLDRDELNQIVKMCGGTELFEIDHIIPILSNTVCGLHCEDNLQILTASENRTKSNNYQQDW